MWVAVVVPTSSIVQSGIKIRFITIELRRVKRDTYWANKEQLVVLHQLFATVMYEYNKQHLFQ